MATIVEDTIISGRPVNWPVSGEMHFRLVDATLGQLDLSCENGYVVRSYEFGFPELREVVYMNSVDDGTLDDTRFVGSRAVTLDMVLRNTLDIQGRVPMVRSESYMRDQLLKFCSPSVRPVLLFSEHQDDRVRSLMIRGSDAPHAVSREKFNEITASWVAPKGFIENVDTHAAEFTFGEDDLLAEYIVHTINEGTVPAWWTLTIKGNLNSPFIRLGDRELWLNYHITSDAVVVIDSRTRTVRINGNPVGYRYLDDRSDWFRIPPGEQFISFSHLSMPRSGLPYAYWQPDPLVTEHDGPTQWATVTSNNISSTVTMTPPPSSYANLPTLKIDPVNGDGHFAHPEQFVPGAYIRLGDTTQAWYNGAIWAAGFRPYENEDGAPPWIWTPDVPTGGGGVEPVTSTVTLSYREQFL